MFIITSCYRGHLALVRHNTNLATVHCRVAVGGCSVEYKYKLLCQFTKTVGGTRCYLWFKESQNNSLQGHTKRFCSYVETEHSSSGWKTTGYSQNGYKLREQTMANWKISISKMLHVALHQCRTNRENTGIWHSVCNEAGKLSRSLYLYFTQQPPTVTWLCTVVKLLLCQTRAKCTL